MAKDSGKFILPEDYAVAIGRSAEAWGQLEIHIDRSIWALAQVEQQLGACVTAQFQSIHPRMRAFIALADINGASEKTVSELRTYYSKCLSGLADKKKRQAHDPRMVQRGTGQVVRLETAAKPNVHFDFKPEDLEELAKLHNKIDEAVEKFIQLRNRVLDELNNLPPESRPQLKRIVDLPPVPTGQEPD